MTIESPKQLLHTPNNVQIDEQQFTKEFHDQLIKAYGKEWPQDVHLSASPYPFFIPKQIFGNLGRLNNVLTKALNGIVDKWFTHETLYKTIPLIPKVSQVLQSLEDRPYQIGSIRPDFLFTQDYSVKICEINARFQFNGFMLSHFGQQVLIKCQNGTFYDTNLCSSIDPLGVLEVGFAKVYSKSVPLVVCREKEAGYDIHMFCHVWNGPIRMSKPCDFHVKDDRLYDSVGIVEQVALELHQSELESLSLEVLTALSKVCHNDLRTIFLVHDKRMLTLLSNVELMTSLEILSAEEAQFLSNGIAETRLGTQGFNLNKSDWLVKPTGSGKGQGIIFGKDVDESQWKSLLNDGHILQKLVNQPTFELQTVAIPSSPQPKHVNWSVVGTFFSINSYFIGPSVWRSSPSDIVAVSRGGMMMFGYTEVEATRQEDLQEELFKVQQEIHQLKMEIKKPLTGKSHGIKTEKVTTKVSTLKNLQLRKITLSRPFKSFDWQPGLLTPGVDSPLSPLTPNTFSSKLPVLPIPKNADVTVTHAPKNTIEDVMNGMEPDVDFLSWSLQIKAALESTGYCITRLGFLEDAGKEGKTMEYLTRLFGKVNSHSSATDALWDIRPKTTLSRRMTLKRNMNVARSHTMDEFEWHTDCSFEQVPPRFMGLQVIHPDKCGGGFFRVMALDDLCDFMGEDAMKVLESNEFELMVPPEFRKDDGKTRVVGPIVTRQDFSKRYSPKHHRLIRFRADITKPLTTRASEALEKLCEGIRTADQRGCLWRLGEEEMKEGTILFCDNARFLHSRTSIKDPQRWLKRIRFHPLEESWMPHFETV